MTPAKSGRAGLGPERCLWKWMKRSNFPVSVFWGGAEWASGGAKRRGFAAKVPRPSTLENQGLPTCDSLPGSWEPKWKSRLTCDVSWNRSVVMPERVLARSCEGGQMVLTFSTRRLSLALLLMAVTTAANMSKAAPLQRKHTTVVAFAHVTVIDGTGAPAKS